MPSGDELYSTRLSWYLAWLPSFKAEQTVRLLDSFKLPTTFEVPNDVPLDDAELKQFKIYLPFSSSDQDAENCWDDAPNTAPASPPKQPTRISKDKLQIQLREAIETYQNQTASFSGMLAQFIPFQPAREARMQLIQANKAANLVLAYGVREPNIYALEESNHDMVPVIPSLATNVCSTSSVLVRLKTADLVMPTASTSLTKQTPPWRQTINLFINLFYPPAKNAYCPSPTSYELNTQYRPSPTTYELNERYNPSPTTYVLR